MAKLKVYRGSADGRNIYCVAASSRSAVIEAFAAIGIPLKMHDLASHWSVTGNPTQIEAAMNEPGTVFASRGWGDRDYRPLRSHDDVVALRRSAA